jgi:archaellum biogenesis ATPase FlaH
MPSGIEYPTVMQQCELVRSGIDPVDRQLGGLPARGITIWWGAPGGGKTTAALAFLRVSLSSGEAAGVVTTHTAEALREQAWAQQGLDLGAYERSGQLALFGVAELGPMLSPDPHQSVAALRQTLVAECGRRSMQRLVFDPLDPLVANTRPDDVEQLASEFEALFGQLGTTTLCTAYRGLGRHQVLEVLAGRAPATFDATPQAVYVRRASWSTLSGKSLSLDTERPYPASLISVSPQVAAQDEPDAGLNGQELPRERRATRRGDQLKSTSRDLPSARIHERAEELRPTRPFERVSREELIGQQWESAPPLPDELGPADDDVTDPRSSSGPRLEDDYGDGGTDNLPTSVHPSHVSPLPRAVATEASDLHALDEPAAEQFDATFGAPAGGLNATATTVDPSLSLRFSSEFAVGEGFDDDEPTATQGSSAPEVSESVLFGGDDEDEEATIARNEVIRRRKPR